MRDDTRLRQMVHEVLTTHRAPEEVCDDPHLLPLLRQSLELVRPGAVPPGQPAPSSPATIPYREAAPEDVGNELPTIAGYALQRVLGRGGMGIVYLARNQLMDRLEVLKLVDQRLLGRPQSVARFLREIHAAAKLSHPNIVTAYTALQLGELLVLAMEYVDGEDLACVVKARGPLPVGNACAYAYQAAMGLQHAFEQGMVHRDVKPHNLILAHDGKKHVVKILDFGLAKATGVHATAAHPLTVIGTMMGTPDYIAPEQIVDAAAADTRADIYSLGGTLYFLLSGHRPFPDKTGAELLLAHQTLMPRPLTELARMCRRSWPPWWRGCSPRNLWYRRASVTTSRPHRTGQTRPPTPS